jgi:hypothetical protein
MPSAEPHALALLKRSAVAKRGILPHVCVVAPQRDKQPFSSVPRGFAFSVYNGVYYSKSTPYKINRLRACTLKGDAGRPSSLCGATNTLLSCSIPLCTVTHGCCWHLPLLFL